jgi:hypothetical protein
MKPQTKELLLSYARSVGAVVIGAVITVYQVTHRAPFAFTGDDWIAVANAIWVAVIPVATRFLNPNDSAFGVKKK